MNPKFLNNETRRIVWTVSASDTNKYCLYLSGRLVVENASFENFYNTYNNLLRN
jgi:hypothetical protein